MTRLVAPVLLALSLLVSACCSCGGGDADPGPKRPGDVVRDLRDAVSQQHWAVAKACFSDELQSRHAAAMLSGEFFQVKAHRDTLADGKPCPCLGGPTGREPEEVEVAFPLGAGDVVLAVQALDADRAEATISPLHPTHRTRGLLTVSHMSDCVAPEGEEPRPQTIVLARDATKIWKIADLKLAQPHASPGATPGCPPSGK